MKLEGGKLHRLEGRGRRAGENATKKEEGATKEREGVSAFCVLSDG